MNLETLLASNAPVLLDGAMGTELAKAGLPMGGQNNLSNPDQVFAIHEAYAQAGSQILITNTLTMNRVFIETHNLGLDMREVNAKGAELARSAAAKGQLVLGDISSTGHMLEPYGTCSETRAYAAFREQAECLAEGGVDGFIVETLTDLREALCAVRACKAAAPLPVVATLSFQTTERGGRTIMGDTASDSAKALEDAGAQAVGANCGSLDPSETAQIVAFMREATSLPLVFQPNGGKPKLIEGRTVFDLAPEQFAQGIAECIRAGARLVGGCCGTSPDHIRAVAELIRLKRSI